MGLNHIPVECYKVSGKTLHNIYLEFDKKKICLIKNINPSKLQKPEISRILITIKIDLLSINSHL